MDEPTDPPNRTGSDKTPFAALLFNLSRKKQGRRQARASGKQSRRRKRYKKQSIVGGRKFWRSERLLHWRPT